MGYSAYSYLVFGIKTSKDAINKTVQTRGCKHPIQENAKFCSECGKPAHISTKSDTLEPMERNQLSYFYSDPESQDDIVIGFLIAKTDYNKDIVEADMNVKHIVEMIDELTQFCQERQLHYTEKNMNYYLLTYHSY